MGQNVTVGKSTSSIGKVEESRISMTGSSIHTVEEKSSFYVSLFFDIQAATTLCGKGAEWFLIDLKLTSAQL